MPQQFVVVLHGPLCGGKTATADCLLERVPKLFRASTDKIKWLLSDYRAGNYQGLPNKMTLALVELALAEGLSIVVEGNLRIQTELWHMYKALAVKHGAVFLEFNIEAKWETLERRFAERVEKARLENTKISVTTLSAMRERYDAYVAAKRPDVPTLMSDELEASERVKVILQSLKEVGKY